jgi:hypothetical protein
MNIKMNQLKTITQHNINILAVYFEIVHTVVPWSLKQCISTNFWHTSGNIHMNLFFYQHILVHLSTPSLGTTWNYCEMPWSVK